MKSNIIKRGVAGLLSLVMCISTFVGIGTTTAFAAGEQAEVYLVSFPRSGDTNLDYSGTWGHPNLHYLNGWNSGESKFTIVRAMHSYVIALSLVHSRILAISIPARMKAFGITSLQTSTAPSLLKI